MKRLASTLFVTLAVPAVSIAEEVVAAPYEEIIVTGQAGMMQMALERQRLADNIISAINADSIGSLPDNNLAEALQRVPGISIERDQGEGRFIRVRGISPDLNAVSVNGVQLSAPEAGRRAVALDVIPSTLLSSVIVSKTLTPAMDANSIGGNIEVESISALARERAFYNLKAEASFDALTEQASPALALSGGNVINRGGDSELGVVMALSWDKRRFGSDNVETGGAWEFGDGEAQLEEIEQRDYRIERERSGAALNFDLQLDESNLLFWRTLYSEFTDDEQRISNVIEFGELDDEDEFDGAGRAAGELGLAEVKRELKDRAETQKIFATSVGGEHQRDAWQWSYTLGHSKASEREPGSVDTAAFEGDVLDNSGFYHTREPSPSMPAAFFDPTFYALAEVEYVEAKTEDEQNSAQVDATFDVALAHGELQWQFGLKTSQREKSQAATVRIFEDFNEYGIDDAQLNLSNYSLGEADYGLGGFGTSITAPMIRALLAGLDADEFIDEEESRLADHIIDEDVHAAYFASRLTSGPWLILIGLRYEATEQAFNGTALNNDDTFSALSTTSDYDHWLPNAQVRFELTDNTQIRSAWTHSVVRPTFEQLAPSFIDSGDEAEFGNPQLEPLTSANIDLGIEHFSGTAGVLSAFIFHKDIEDFVYATDIAGTAGWEAYDEVLTYANGDDARLTGIELAYSRKLEQLPKPFDGLLVAFNATFSESDAGITASDDGELVRRDIPLPNQSDSTGNMILGYENDRLSLRAALNYKSEYLLEVTDPLEPLLDIYQEAQTQVDLSAHYSLTERLKLEFEINNLFNEPYYTYVNNRNYNAQYEEYGVAYRFSITYSQF